MSETTKKTATAITNDLRNKYLSRIVDLLKEEGEDVRFVKGNQFIFPVTDEVNDERFMRITVEVPRGSRDGVAYDGYAEAEAYEVEQVEKEEKAAEVARKKAEKEAKKVKKDAE